MGMVRNPGSGLDHLREGSKNLLIIGIAIMVLGAFAIIASQITTFAVIAIFAIVLIVAGIARFMHAFRVRKWEGIILSVAVGALYLVLGISLLRNPGLGAVTLTLVMVFFFLTIGVLKIAAALLVRFPSWGWVFANGLLSLVLGIIIWVQLPSAALWVIGLFIGIDLVFDGWSIVLLSLLIRRLTEIE